MSALLVWIQSVFIYVHIRRVWHLQERGGGGLKGAVTPIDSWISERVHSWTIYCVVSDVRFTDDLISQIYKQQLIHRFSEKS